jgi:hypothetical protein
MISLLVALSIFIFGCAPKEEMPRLIALEDFFKNPEKTAFSLSPDGEHLAFKKPWKKRMNIHVQKIGEEEAVCAYYWCNGKRYCRLLLGE